MFRSSASLLILAAALGAQSPLETTFANPAPGFQVTATPSPITGLFDLTVTEPQGIVLTQIDVQMNTSHGTNGQVGVWMTAAGGTAVGNHLNAAVWSQVSSAAQVHAGGRVSLTLQTPVAIAPGTYGLALHCIQANPVYHGGAVSPTLPQVYSNVEMAIDMSACRVRISDAVDPFGGTSNGFTPRQLAVAMHYVVGSFYADFTPSVTGGTSPLDVQFTSSVASQAGVQSYAWDFDNDGLTDSTLANPMYQFGCGTHTVSMTVTDNNGATAVVTKTDLIVTDVVTPRFSNTLVAPGMVQFTDLSTPTPDTWSWDFDNDGIEDSNLQNPTWSFANTCDEAIVSLTASLACQSPSTLTKPVAVATSLESTFASGLVTSGTALSSANYFDLAVSNPLGISVCSMHVNSSVAAGSPVTVNIYVTEDTYVGKTGDASLWRLAGSATVNSLATGGRTFVQFSPAIYLPAGSFGICMEHIGGSPVYTNLGGTQVYSTADVTMTLGASQNEPVFDPATTVFSPRIANVALHYSTSQVTSVAGYGYLASGCVGSLGTPTNVALSQPVLGTSCNIEISGLPLDLGVLVLGLSAMTPGMDLSTIGMPGCRLFAAADALETIAGTGNSAVYSLAVPSTTSLIGTLVYTQAGSLDQNLNPLQMSISDAAVALVGQ
ncbi:MAG: PKD domain-containing protein [Planctomycetota bacterium]